MDQGKTHSIMSVKDCPQWFRWKQLFFDKGCWVFVLGSDSAECHQNEQNAQLLSFIHVLYDKKIGEITSRWNDSGDGSWILGHDDWDSCERIEFRHAQVKLGDLFDYYTTNGELAFPPWVQFKYVVEDYLQNSSRNQAFIEAKNTESLEEME